MSPDDPLAHKFLGKALAKQSRFPEAEAEYRQVLRLRPDDASTHYNLGVALARQAKHVEAEAEYRQALRLRWQQLWADVERTLKSEDHQNTKDTKTPPK